MSALLSPEELFGESIRPGGEIYREGNVVALFFAVPEQNDIWEVHVAAEKSLRGKTSCDVFRRARAWFWQTRPAAKTLLGLIPPEHRAARHNAVQLGFSFYSIMELTDADGMPFEAAIYYLEREN